MPCCQTVGHGLSQVRQKLLFEPWIAPQPRRVSPRGMRQRKDCRRMIAPCLDRGRHRFPPQMPPDRMPAHQKCQPWLQQRHDLCPPGCRADRWRRQIRPLGIISRKTEGHRHDRDSVQVIESGLVDPHPVTQSLARAVGEGSAAFMDPHPWRLPRDQDPRTGPEPHHRARRVARCRGGKAIAAQAARRNLIDQGGHK